EILAPEKLKHPDVVKFLSDFKKTLQKRIKSHHRSGFIRVLRVNFGRYCSLAPWLLPYISSRICAVVAPREQASPESARDFEALLKEIDFRKSASIISRIRQYVKDKLGEEDEKIAKEAYNIRSKLTHTGRSEPQEVAEAARAVQDILGKLLKIELGN
ncbi:MAG: hypothetical protein SFY81_16455, partial [Verrucomicrobiota bacterium]|nr:hypothetical protein [Verrucomicrobiota bacterium]